ncbi:pancreatic triacylglycerol lipase-like [Lasioglossum baleicum]|uniref:pancreatic triacylglycerol lipase-like n=1 Tax=Lasioglossum baleicum TaxID=434251 RepID=UPI003FCD9EB2
MGYALVSLLLVCGAYAAFPRDVENEVVHTNVQAPEIRDLMNVETYDESEEQTRKDLHNRVFFYLYTKANPTNHQQLHLNDLNSLRRSNFNAKRPTKFITHGWINSAYSDAFRLIRDAYLKQGDFNIIAIDWSSISVRPYIWATKRVVMVGQYSASMIDFLRSQGMDLSQVTVVGHSLGGHVAGLAAHYAKGQVSNVVALDPALPEFHSANKGSRVSRDDAAFVQVIHSNGAILGFEKAIGHVDFYPNGGAIQAGCITNTCSHLRSYEYFSESINSKNGFWAAKCDSFLNFRKGACNGNNKGLMGGLNQDRNLRGTYFLHTNSKAPFARGRI